MKYSQELLGTRLDITLINSEDTMGVVEQCFLEVRDFENKYSRFIKGNILDNLNTNKSSQASGELLSILKLCQKVSTLTDGYFDITIRPLLENLGYGKEREVLDENIGYNNIKIEGEMVLLKNGVSIDLGAVGKGYMIDKIYNILDKHYSEYIIDFGGDIKVKGEQKLHLEDPKNEGNVIGDIILENTSIASSTGMKRKIGNEHHLMNPKEKKSQNDKLAVYVTHPLASFSDTFSTALFVTPFKKSIQILQSVPDLEGMIITKEGEIFKSKNFNSNLYITGKSI